jgi:formiminotetrahydrofolate cyclodeaminase
MMNQSLRGYLDLLKSDAPAPGGGSASALSGAQGMALIMMVANLTNGREAYKEHWELCENALKEGSRIMEELILCIEKDTDAYNQVMKAYQLPKENDEEKDVRKMAIREATLVATQVPFDAMVLALEGLKTADSLVGKSNANCSSDLGVAALNLLACGQGVWLNILTNLSGIKNPEKEKEFETEGAILFLQIKELAQGIYKRVEEAL